MADQCFLKQFGLSKESDRSKPDKNGMTTVNRAVAFGDLLLLDRMLSNGCPDVNVGDNDGNTPLIYAVSLGHHLVVMRLLRCTSIEVDKRNNYGITALMKAAIHNHGTCVELLLKAGVNVDLTDYRRQMTALQWAKHCGSQQCVKILHKHNKRLSKNKSQQCRYVRSLSDLTFESSSPDTAHKHRKSNVLIDKLKHSLGLPTKQQSRSNECLLTLSGMVASSTSAIPMLLGVPQDNHDWRDDFSLSVMPHFLRKKSQTKSIGSPPVILITKDNGEVVDADSIKHKSTRRRPSSHHHSNNNNKPPPAPVSNKISAK